MKINLILLINPVYISCEIIRQPSDIINHLIHKLKKKLHPLLYLILILPVLNIDHITHISHCQTLENETRDGETLNNVL